MATSTIDSTIATNLTAPLQLTTALLAHLKQQPQAAILMVPSGLAFTLMAMTPSYCVTKAAIHSWTISLRYQLMDTSVEVLPFAPPLRANRAHGRAPGQRSPGHAPR